MSTVMRPRGPLPPRVYWTRRVLVLVIVGVAAIGGWWLLPGGGRSGAASADPGTTTSTPPANAPHKQNGPAHHVTPTRPTSSRHTSALGSTSGRHTGTPPSHHHGSQPPASQPPASQPPASGPPSEITTTTGLPTGHCDPARLRLGLEVGRAVERRGARIGLRMSTTDGSTCRLGVMPSRLEIEITSGDVSIWHSTTCPDGLPARNVVVGPRSAVVYSFRWDGHIDPNACREGRQIAEPGGYWVAAALIGGEPARLYFPVVSAPAHT